MRKAINKRKLNKEKKQEECQHRQRIELMFLLAVVFLIVVQPQPWAIQKATSFFDTFLTGHNLITGAFSIQDESTADDDLVSLYEEFTDGFNQSRFVNSTIDGSMHIVDEALQMNGTADGVTLSPTALTKHNITMLSFNLSVNITVMNDSNNFGVGAYVYGGIGVQMQQDSTIKTYCAVQVNSSGNFRLVGINETTGFANTTAFSFGNNMSGVLNMQFDNETNDINCSYKTGGDYVSFRMNTTNIGQNSSVAMTSFLDNPGDQPQSIGSLNITYDDFNYSFTVAGDTPVDCGIITENTTMDQNVVADGTCFSFGDHGIELDCDNYTIDYADSVFGYGVNSSNYHNNTIKNCRIIEGTGTGTSIFLSNSSRGRIFNNTVVTQTATGIGILLASSGNYTSVWDNRINTSGSAAYTIDSATFHNNFTNNTLTQTSGAGIRVVFEEGGHNSYIGNTIRGYATGAIGMDIASDNNTIINNSFWVNASAAWGIRFDGGNSSLLINNSIISNGPTGIGIYLTSDAGDNMLINNYINASQNDAFEIRDDTGDDFLNNLKYRNGTGEIVWIDNGSKSFARNLTLNGTIGINDNMLFGATMIAFNTSAFSHSAINSSANLTMNQLTSISAVGQIMKVHNYTLNAIFISNNGVDCLGDQCTTIDFADNILQFNVTSLSSYVPTNTDTSPPLVNFSAPINGSNFSLSSSNQTFNMSIFELDIDAAVFEFLNLSKPINVTASNNSGFWTASYNVSTLSEGYHSVIGFANDTEANINKTTILNFRVDLSPPNVSQFNFNVSPLNGSNYTGGFIMINVTVNDTITFAPIVVLGIKSFREGLESNFSLVQNGSLWNREQNLAVLGEGLNVFTVYANDSVNNMNFTVANLSIRMDFNPPNVTIFNINATAHNASNFSSGILMVNVTVNDTATFVPAVIFGFKNEKNGTQFNVTPIQNGSLWNTELDLSTLQDGLHTIYVYAEDSVGRVNKTYNLSFTFDNTAPNVTIFNINATSNNASNFSAGYLMINVTVNDSVTFVPTVIFGFTNLANSSQFNVTPIQNGSLWNTELDLSTLQDGLHTIYVYANDTLDNLNVTRNLSFRIDKTAPAVNISSPAASADFETTVQNRTFNASIKETNYVQRVVFMFSNASGTDFNLTPDNQSGYWIISYNISTLSTGSHTMTVIANDSTSNTNQSVSVSFTVSEPSSSPATTNNGGGGSSSSSPTAAATTTSPAPSPSPGVAQASQIGGKDAGTSDSEGSDSKGESAKGVDTSASAPEKGKRAFATGMAIFSDITSFAKNNVSYVLGFTVLILLGLGVTTTIPKIRRKRVLNRKLEEMNMTKDELKNNLKQRAEEIKKKIIELKKPSLILGVATTKEVVTDPNQIEIERRIINVDHTKIGSTRQLRTRKVDYDKQDELLRIQKELESKISEVHQTETPQVQIIGKGLVKPIVQPEEPNASNKFSVKQDDLEDEISKVNQMKIPKVQMVEAPLLNDGSTNDKWLNQELEEVKGKLKGSKMNPKNIFRELARWKKKTGDKIGKEKINKKKIEEI